MQLVLEPDESHHIITLLHTFIISLSSQLTQALLINNDLTWLSKAADDNSGRFTGWAPADVSSPITTAVCRVRSTCLCSLATSLCSSSCDDDDDEMWSLCL